MSLVAVISRQPPLELAEWLTVVAADPRMTAEAAQVRINPFTGKPKEYPARPECASISDAGLPIGAIEPSPEFARDRELHVFAPDGGIERARPIVEEIAGRLNAMVEWAE